MFSMLEYIIILLVTTVLCVVAVTYLSYKEEQHDSSGIPPDVLRTDDVDQQSKSNRNLSQGHTVAFTFKVTFK